MPDVSINYIINVRVKGAHLTPTHKAGLLRAATLNLGLGANTFQIDSRRVTCPPDRVYLPPRQGSTRVYTGSFFKRNGKWKGTPGYLSPGQGHHKGPPRHSPPPSPLLYDEAVRQGRGSLFEMYWSLGHSPSLRSTPLT